MSDVQAMVNGFKFTVSQERLMRDNCDRHYAAYYQTRGAGTLSQLCDTYGSDKGSLTASGHPYSWPAHTYADFYEARFAHCREHIKLVFECGLGTNDPATPSSMGSTGRPGASLRVWRDYFPNAQIYGADIDRSTLFQDERIATFHVDQTSPASIHAMWQAIGVTGFDLIIDDGLHTFDAGVSLFANAFEHLRPGGLYVIEDVAFQHMIEFRRYFGAMPHPVEYVLLHRDPVPIGDNALIAVRR